MRTTKLDKEIILFSAELECIGDGHGNTIKAKANSKRKDIFARLEE